MSFVAPIVPRTRRNVELALLLLAIGMALGAYALVGLSIKGHVPPDLLAVGGGFMLVALGFHMVLRRFAPYSDPVILPIVTALNGLGLVIIHRLDLFAGKDFGEASAPDQLIWTTLGVLAAIGVLIVLKDHRGLARYTYTAMIVSLVLLLLPLVPGLGHSVLGARIWIFIAGMSFQPGELAKISLAIFFAGYLVMARDALSLVGRKVLGLQLPRGKDLGPLILVWVASLGVLVFEKDLGTSLLFFGLFVALLYVATERTSWIVIGLLLFVGGALVAWQTFAHVQQRVEYWLNAFEPENLDHSSQLVQGIYGMASGGLLGTGLGEGMPGLVPFADSDFIFSSIGEELGLTGIFALLLLYVLLVERAFRIAIGVRDGFGKLLAGGLAFSIALQCFVVAGGVTRVIPLTGLVMPFLAKGGSSLLSNWMIVALLLRISDSARRPPSAGPAGAPPPDPSGSDRQEVTR